MTDFYLCATLTPNDIFSKENPGRADEGPESQEESNEEPNSSASYAEAAGRVGFSAKLSVRDRVYPTRRAEREN